MRRALALATLALAAATVATSSSCSQDPIEVELRSLQRSGAVSFVCLGPPSASGSAARPLTACTAELADAPDDFLRGTDDDGGELPHLYALITQKTRGELAIVDLTSDTSNVLDQDPATPGPSFLPIGAQPMDIASTPNGTATFVTTAEVGRPAIYAIPSNRMRPCSVDPTRCNTPAPTLTSWPACTLPAAPGDIVVAYDPPQETGTRGTCDGGAAAPPGSHGDLDAEGRGRQKLIVALPRLGQLVVLDAQQVLDSPPGQLPACTIERTIDLSTDVPAPSGEPPYEDGEACVVPDGPAPHPARAFSSTPSSLWLSDGRLYVGDLTAPLVHVLRAESACDLVELPPLHATSQEDPNRIVATTKVAASDRLAPDFKRYVYAVDVEDRSLMVFDVTDGDGGEPLRRPNPELNPLQPPDRLRFGSAPTDVIVVERDEPKQLPQTGTAPYGQRCDPRNVQDCDVTSTSCIPGTRYQTSSDYEEGAGPYTLRGTFAFVALSDGRVAVVDIDDYDADCRGPRVPSRQYGCEPNEQAAPFATDEASCNVFVPHALRSATYVLDSDLVGRREPGLATFPLLYRDDGTVVDIDDDPTAPRMRAVTPDPPYADLEMHVGSEILPINPATGLVDQDPTEIRQTLAVNLEDPRANNADQEWSITFEGPLPGLEGRAGDLRLGGDLPAFYDAAAGFCDRGVQSEAAQREKLVAAGVAGDELLAAARQLADRLTITQALADQDDPSWEGAACTFQECLGLFGDTTNPQLTRDLVVTEAYGDHLDLATLADEGPDRADFECCFPTLVTYEVRPGSQWVAVGAATGFLHHVVADPVGGACRDSCDPRLVALRGRIRTAPDGPVAETDPLYAFRNPFFRLAITSAGGVPVRNYAFKFTTQGAFSPLVASLIDETTDVLPETINYLPSTGELAIADGSLEGLMLVSTRTMQLNRQFF